MSSFKRNEEMVQQEREFAQATLNILGKGYEIAEVEKTDGVHIGIRASGAKVSPMVYIDAYMDFVCDEQEAAEMITRDLSAHTVPDTSFDSGAVTDWEKAKDRIQVKVINKACATADMVTKSLTRQGFNDLVEVLYVPVKVGGMNGIVTIKHPLLDSYGVSKASVFAKAELNTKPNATLEPLINIIARRLGITPEEYVKSGSEAPNMYVLSNKECSYGAVHAVLNKDILKEKFPDGYYVIPSSIHECLIIPASDDDEVLEESLDDLIESVNEKQVAVSERLSDHHYSFVV